MHQRNKLVFITTLFFIAVSSMVLYTSCIKNKCETVTCFNGGVCVAGICSCPSGYEGNGCTKQWNEKFGGTWHADEVFLRDTTHDLFDVYINANNTLDSFYVAGFANSSSSFVVCQHTGYRSFSIQSNQNLPDSVTTITSGNGMIDSVSGNITGTYMVTKKLATKDTIITTNFTWKK